MDEKILYTSIVYGFTFLPFIDFYNTRVLLLFSILLILTIHNNLQYCIVFVTILNLVAKTFRLHLNTSQRLLTVQI